MRYISVTKTKNGFGEVNGEISTINDKKLTTKNKVLRWNWFNLGKNRFIWQSEQYGTFLSMD